MSLTPPEETHDATTFEGLIDGKVQPGIMAMGHLLTKWDHCLQRRALPDSPGPATPDKIKKAIAEDGKEVARLVSVVQVTLSLCVR